MTHVLGAVANGDFGNSEVCKKYKGFFFKSSFLRFPGAGPALRIQRGKIPSKRVEKAKSGRLPGREDRRPLKSQFAIGCMVLKRQTYGNKLEGVFTDFC